MTEYRKAKWLVISREYDSKTAHSIEKGRILLCSNTVNATNRPYKFNNKVFIWFSCFHMLCQFVMPENNVTFQYPSFPMMETLNDSSAFVVNAFINFSFMPLKNCKHNSDPCFTNYIPSLFIKFVAAKLFPWKSDYFNSSPCTITSEASITFLV